MKETREKFNKRLRRIIDYYDHCEAEGGTAQIVWEIEQVFEEQQKELLEGVEEMIKNIRRFDEKNEYFEGWNSALDVVEGDFNELKKDIINIIKTYVPNTKKTKTNKKNKPV